MYTLPNNESSAIRLKQLRKTYGFTQEKMAEELGISVSLYKAMETGKATVSKRTAEAVENRFGISSDYIYCGTLRNDIEVWNQIYECSDTDKLKILFRLVNYFMAQNVITQDDKNVQDIINVMFKPK